MSVGNKIYDSYIGIPQILSLLVYDKELTQFSISKMAHKEIEPKLSLSNSNSKEDIKLEFKRIKKSLKPPSEFWNDLELIEGENLLEFVFKGNLDKEYKFKTRIFYYPFK